MVYDAVFSCADTIKYHSMVSDEQNFANRITLQSIMLNSEYKEFAKEVDEYLLNHAQINGFSTNQLCANCT